MHLSGVLICFALNHHCAITAPSLHQVDYPFVDGDVHWEWSCTSSSVFVYKAWAFLAGVVTSMHHHCTITAPSLHHHCAITDVE